MCVFFTFTNIETFVPTRLTIFHNETKKNPIKSKKKSKNCGKVSNNFRTYADASRAEKIKLLFRHEFKNGSAAN